MVKVFAPAKINLTLHVTDQNDAGYHVLDSLVAFASVGDDIHLAPGKDLTLSVSGPEAAGVPTGPENLALAGAGLLAGAAGASLSLTKRLPIASGMGGGSADAAAAFRAMLVHGEAGNLPIEALRFKPDHIYRAYADQLLSLGADVPMCLLSRPVRARGIGEVLRVVSLPRLSAVLVNPRVAVSTPDVFGALRDKRNPAMPVELPEFGDPASVIAFLSEMRNDLEAPAVSLAPEIADVLDTLRGTQGCALARMSGSGATCFGLYEVRTDAGDAARALREAHPDWWVADCWLGDQLSTALPYFD